MPLSSTLRRSFPPIQDHQLSRRPPSTNRPDPYGELPYNRRIRKERQVVLQWIGGSLAEWPWYVLYTSTAQNWTIMGSARIWSPSIIGYSHGA
ncbi:hypothetical protein C8Q76DRAFT_174981 [Earliella scabrosa]|nr:hypothetical protein C8Q76DRAFT_174981 [Earliella scabrosa]